MRERASQPWTSLKNGEALFYSMFYMLHRCCNSGDLCGWVIVKRDRLQIWMWRGRIFTGTGKYAGRAPRKVIALWGSPSSRYVCWLPFKLVCEFLVRPINDFSFAWNQLRQLCTEKKLTHCNLFMQNIHATFAILFIQWRQCLSPNLQRDRLLALKYCCSIFRDYVTRIILIKISITSFKNSNSKSRGSSESFFFYVARSSKSIFFRSKF